jgi:hypothetical protein
LQPCSHFGFVGLKKKKKKKIPNAKIAVNDCKASKGQDKGARPNEAQQRLRS